MAATSLDELLALRVDKQGEVAVNPGDVLRWSEAHRETAVRHWPDRTPGWVAPPAMVTSFLRPLEWRPERREPPAHKGSSLHERLKAELGHPLGIATGYELELNRLLRDGDRVEAVERIASVGEPETTRLGPGRRWVIENEIRLAGEATGAGDLVAVERFSMLGYDPTTPEGGSTRSGDRSESSHLGVGEARLEDLRAADRVEELDVTAVAIAMGASANRVWTPAHLDREAAQAAGVRDVFLDTSTQVGLLGGVAVRAAGQGPDARPGRLSLRMRRPICPGDRLVMEARVSSVEPDAVGVGWCTAEVRAVVDDVVHSTLTARVAVAGPAGRPDPWALDGDIWRP